MQTFIKNAVIVDGSGKDRFVGALLIDDSIISEILPETSTSEDYMKTLEEKVDFAIDAEHMVCAPGFIDTHSHSDLKVLSEPELLPKLHQGITTEVLGQDGVSMAPLPIEYIEPWKKNIGGLDGQDENISWEFKNTEGYLSMVENAHSALNEAYLIPHGNIRMEAMGLSDRKATPEELKKMCDILRREMEAGGIGLSSGLIYMPCAYSDTEELIELCKVVKEYNGVFVVHQRSEADTILESMEEIIRVGKESGADIHFSHFKVCGKKNWDKLDGMMKLLDKAKEEGIKVSLDQYPYVAGSTMLGVILPPWAHDGGTDMLVERLKDEKLREKMKEDIANGIEGWDNFVQFAGVDEIYITSVASEKNADAIGLSLSQLGKKRGKEALDATFDLLMEERNAVGMVDFYGTEDHVKAIMKRPEMNACTDGLLSGKPHPRAYGSFPRILGKYVREEELMSLEEAIAKLTNKAAKACHIHNRGCIQAGNYADITIFNPDTIIDKGTFTEPESFPEGIIYVIVNGIVEIDHGEVTGNRAGQVLRKGGK